MAFSDCRCVARQSGVVGEPLRGPQAVTRVPTPGAYAGLRRQFGEYKPEFYIVFGRGAALSVKYYKQAYERIHVCNGQQQV